MKEYRLGMRKTGARVSYGMQDAMKLTENPSLDATLRRDAPERII